MPLIFFVVSVAAIVCAAGWLTGCSTPARDPASPIAVAAPSAAPGPPADGLAVALPDPSPRLPAAAFDADVLLLGEVHDNGAQHAIRARWLAELVAARRFALLLEQFDRASQPAIDAALRDGVPPRELAERAGFRFAGWQWSFYEPYLRLAIDSRLPLAGGNLSSAELMAIARGQRPAPELMTAPGVDWRDVDEAAMRAAIDAGHCGKMPASALDRMIVAQRARDAGLAQTVLDAHRRTGLPVVVLAGNGHVRRDLGAPRYLRAAWPQARIVSIGFEEAATTTADPAAAGERGRAADAGGAASTGSAPRYDGEILTAAQPRPDPCAAFESRR
ncbi:MAG: ChaN family lipoprotein [Burkholderiaceae bacterium]